MATAHSGVPFIKKHQKVPSNVKDKKDMFSWSNCFLIKHGSIRTGSTSEMVLVFSIFPFLSLSFSST